jgi:hypothetical protein
VTGSKSHSLVRGGASWSHVFFAVDAVYGGLLLIAGITLDHIVDVSSRHLQRFGEGGDEGGTLKRLGSFTQSGEGERRMTLVAAERQGRQLLL